MVLYCDVNALQKFAEIAFLSKNGCYLAKALSFRKFHADSIEEKQASFQAVSLQERKEHPEIVQSSIAQSHLLSWTHYLILLQVPDSCAGAGAVRCMYHDV